MNVSFRLDDWKPASAEKDDGYIYKRSEGTVQLEYKNAKVSDFVCDADRNLTFLQNKDQPYVFAGFYQQPKEGECVLIFDGKQVRIERVSGNVLGLRHVRQLPSHQPQQQPQQQQQQQQPQRGAASSAPAAAAAATQSQPTAGRKRTAAQSGRRCVQRQQPRAQGICGADCKCSARRSCEQGGSGSGSRAVGGDSAYADQDELLSMIEQSMNSDGDDGDDDGDSADERRGRWRRTGRSDVDGAGSDEE